MKTEPIEYYCVAEVAKLLPRADGGVGLRLSRVYDLIQTELIRAEKVNGRLVVRQEELDRVLREYQPRQVKRPIAFGDAVDRIAAVMDKQVTGAEAAGAFPPVSESYISRLASGERWPAVREAALEFIAERREALQNEQTD